MFSPDMARYLCFRVSQQIVPPAYFIFLLSPLAVRQVPVVREAEHQLCPGFEYLRKLLVSYPLRRFPLLWCVLLHRRPPLLCGVLWIQAKEQRFIVRVFSIL